MENKKVEVIVVGGGHAGVEAALISARLGKRVVLVTLRIDQIAKMPCNPSIGGPAKGIVVREIDALGGQMGVTADKTALQVKMLNTTKGPGVQSLRVQSDKIAYAKMMQDILQNQENLEIVEGQVQACLFDGNKVIGVQLEDRIIESEITILTTGTYMSSLVMVSDHVKEEGPDKERTTKSLSKSLEEKGIELFRLKTGTPPRILKNSIDFNQVERQTGASGFYSFSTETEKMIALSDQEDCHLTYTTANTHQIIFDNLDKSSMYSGVVKGVGPRYCPSIEDKLVRFKDKERHQLFLEPESKLLDTIYIQGFSSSMPYDIQEKMVHSIIGLENAVIEKYAYAIEYDAINPLQLKASLELKKIENLFSAGQINGTSGYEEAAGQGLLAGINAVRKIDKQQPLVLNRDEAYLGVMVDDLVTKGTKEPYRLLTSRAEFRLLLRHDNADQRLMKKGYEIGTISEKRYQKYQYKMQLIEDGKKTLRETRFTPKSQIAVYLESLGFDVLQEGISAYELLKRPAVTCQGLQPYLNNSIEESIGKQIEIEVKYEGYIVKAKKEAERLVKMDHVLLPEEWEYDTLENLSLEAKQKLAQVKPRTMGQASRISGVSPSDVATLAILLEQKQRRKKNEN
ncbi:MAG: tRNA uridine-5-carboxymethylaminomethyl(34) synthesis enzyme MnmG [Anaerorhabdus sp.]